MKKLLFVVMFCASVSAAGMDGDGASSVQGVTGCEKYAEEIKTKGGSYITTMGWVAGFLTAYNRQTPGTYDILGNADLASAMLWLENYCKAHPLSDLAGGMNVLTDEFYPRRHKTKEEAGR